MKHRPSVRRFLSQDLLALGAAQEFTKLVNMAIESRGVCRIALAGGETPRRLYNRLSKPPFLHALDWSKVHVFFGDERAVPSTDRQSNFGMAYHELLSRVDVPDANIHRIQGETDPGTAARLYQDELEREFGGAEVRFDLILLGLGEDGHTASLFPRTESVLADIPLVCPVYVPLLESWRITFTFRTINNAYRVLFLVAGQEKAPILERILTAPSADRDLPATLVQPKEGTTLWLVDNDAASRLKDPLDPLPGQR